ncbi:hypothetical protein DSM112329_04147 [Paraconexibacter sp. AEG42_29]|uniref:Histidine kinase domain-containing protein n=1 Tax=Paraconexibacter sp. AEG42_29 TaxID=2997339 RepID=A0AAU7B067_9ACTN
MTPDRDLGGTLHATLCALRPHVPRTVVSKSAMSIASHLIEDLVDTAGAGTVLVSCFQLQRHWMVEHERYDALAAVPGVTVVPVFLPVATMVAAGGAALLPQDPMIDEWFVIALGPTLSVTLAGLDLQDAASDVPESMRTFEAVLTTDADVTRAAVRYVTDVLDDRIPPGAAEMLRHAAAAPPLSTVHHLTVQADHLLAGMFDRIERLRRQERAAHQTSMRLHQEALIAADRERQRLAEALHDESLQLLLAASQDLHEVVPRDPEERALASARGLLEQGLGFLREALGTMYVEDRPTDRLEARLDLLARTLGERGGFDVRLDVDPRAAGAADDAVCALVRELLTNAAKHARAGTVTVLVLRQAEALLVDVADDGVGADPDRLASARAEGHIGLTLAQERVTAAAGSWQLTTAPGAGLRVRATIPVAATG